MKKIFKILVLCIVFSVSKVQSQSNVSNAEFTQGNAALSKFLNKEFGKAAKKYPWPSCLTSVVFAKFYIDSTGNVKNLTFSMLKGTPQILKTMMSSAIFATNGLWTPAKINGKVVTSKPFLLPLIYDLEAGCNPQRVLPDSAYIKKFKPIPNNTDTAVWFMLNFEGDGEGYIDQLDCNLLHPLRIFNIN